MIYSQSLLISVLGYERGKQLAQERSQALWTALEGRVAAFADDYDSKRRTQVECTGDILCERQGTRHKSDCQGRTEPFSAYARNLGSVQ